MKEEGGLPMNNENSFKKDVLNEGKDKVFLDEDRMINEGLSGGSVHMREGAANIEPARDLEEEEPPRK
jgi:hypothetical protein